MIKNSVKYEDLIKDFESRNIPYDSPGFYDHPNFMQVEEKNASYLSNYAKFVHDRPREQSYDDFVKRAVPLVAAIYHEKFTEHGGLKPDTSIAALLSKALEKINIWNYVVKGSMTLDFPAESKIDKRHFWSLDHNGFTTAHVWLVAPPFYVVDITLSLHKFSEAETNYIAPLICAEATNIIEPEIEDVISAGYCSHLQSIDVPRSDYYAVISPQTEKFLRVFPSREVVSDKLKMKYIPVSVSAPDMPFEQMRTPSFNGLTGYEIFENEIKHLIESNQ